MKRLSIIVVVPLLVFSIVNPASSTSAVLETSGTFYGFDYEYGEDTRNFTKSVSYAESFSESESKSKSREYTIWAPLRTGLVIKDILWERWTNRSKAAPSSSWELPGAPQNWRGYRADGLLTNGTGAGGAWYRYHGITVLNWLVGAQVFNLSWFGRQIDVGLAERLFFPTWKTNYTELSIISTDSIPMKDWLGSIYGYTDENTYHIKYFYDKGTPANTADDEVVFEEYLIPRFAFVKIQTTNYQVTVNQTGALSTSLSGQFNFTGTWTENLHGQHVSIKDGTNYGFDYFALISGNVDYEYEGGFTLQGYLSTNITREVTYATNGTPVPEAIRPAWLQSIYLVLDGKWDYYEEEDAVLYGQGAIQSLVQVLLTKASTNQTPNLAVWGNFNPGRIIGYKDVDGDEILTAFLNASRLDTPDALMAVGFPEGAYLEGDYLASAFVNAKVYAALGNWTIVDEDKSKSNTIDRSFNETWGYDPRVPGAGPSDIALKWTDPVESDGKAIFKWETAYEGMPMTWWAKNDSAELVIQDDTDITYGYILTIDPGTGEAVLESTYEQSAISDPQLKTMMSSQEVSMATYRRDYYLSMTKLSADTSGSVARPESQFDTSVAGQDLFSQNFGGAKEKYYLTSDPGTKYSSGTSVINLLTAEGFSGEPTNRTELNPYVSPVSRRIANALTHWSADAHTAGISWIFRENLVITSYPTWKGEGFVHDPAYKVSYAETGERQETDITTGSSSSTGSGTAPGFEFGFTLVILTSVALIVKKRRFD
ncbi:MAG: hypothetical protein ACXAEU_12985 [Candidatus Hodarchaeales archaeon]|jgi:hypothetical protein